MVTLFRILTVLALFNSVTAIACIARNLPDKNFDKYETIFIGEVTGIRLTKYQDAMVKGLRTEANYQLWTDTTQEYEITVLPQRLKKGSASEVEILKVSGCGILEPRVRQIGLFFIKSNGHVNVIYSGESYNYEDYIEAVGIYYRKMRKRLKIKRGQVITSP